MIFIDTGAFLARYIERDQYHRQALRLWEAIGRQGHKCVTSNFVLDETFTLLARRAGYAFAGERARKIFSSNTLVILRSGHEEELMALDFFEKYANHEISYTDCVSFSFMRRKNIHDVFSFDRHFEIAGFRLWTAGN